MTVTEFFNEADIPETAQYVGEADKNGTQHITWTEKCSFCSNGFVGWTDYANSVCFKCQGKGYNIYSGKVYTKTFGEKLQARRQARAEAKAAAEKANRLANKDAKESALFAKYGYVNGKTYVLFGSGTFAHKDEIKAAGGKFYNKYWLCSSKIDGVDSIELLAEDTFKRDELGIAYDWDWLAVDKKIKDHTDAAQKAKGDVSEYYGNVGDKLENLEVTFVKVAGFETQFGYTQVYTFQDAENHEFVWMTASGNIEADIGSKIVLKKATIKDHKEYNHIKQTVLTRCKLA